MFWRVLFCVLLFASSMPPFKESDNVTTDLETRFERSVLQRQPINNKTETNQWLFVGLHVFSGASHFVTCYAFVSRFDWLTFSTSVTLARWTKEIKKHRKPFASRSCSFPICCVTGLFCKNKNKKETSNTQLHYITSIPVQTDRSFV